MRYERSLLYREEFEAFGGTYPNFRFLADAEPSGRHLDRPHRPCSERMFSRRLGDRRDMDVYICGMKAMVDDMRQQLKGLGLDRKRIVFEKYD